MPVSADAPRSKVGLETPQGTWLRTSSLRPRLEAWAAAPAALPLFRHWFADAWLKRFC